MEAGQSLPRRKPIQAESDAGPRRTLGRTDLVALGIGAIVGAGLFTLTGIAAADYAGPAVMISLLIAGFGRAMASLCYSEMAGMIPSAGSAYSHAYAVLGRASAGSRANTPVPSAAPAPSGHYARQTEMTG